MSKGGRQTRRRRLGGLRGSERGPLRPDSRAGFTLVELLVALAIFITIMASVTLLFNAAVRTTKQGYQNQEAFELARGAMRLLENDLSRAFTSRDHGDVYSFYGTPIGFSFVGMVDTEGTDSYNLARVTYVIYHTLDQTAGAVGIYESVGGVNVPTYALLRYVEPGVDNLEEYQIPWTDFIDQDNLNIRLDDLVSQQVLLAACPDAACDEVVRRTARREIWIRMLAGGDDQVPSAWDDLDIFTSQGLRPEDFMIGENIRFLSTDGIQCAATKDALETALDTLGTPLDFDDFVFDAPNGDVCARVTGDANVTPIFTPFDPFNVGDPSPAIPIPNSGPQPFFQYWDIGTFQNARIAVDGIDNDGDGFTDEVGEGLTNDPLTSADDFVGPIAFTFWNDVRNVLADNVDNDNDNAALVIDGIDNDGDGLTDEVNEGVDEPDEVYAVTVGSPLDARLPRAVTVDFTLFFRSPYPGAPDFNQRFTQRIDIPTGFRRAVKATLSEP